ncbi:23S rRNA (uracil-C(5))-methyltransferase RlmCD [Roseovarius sp. THAF27]|uniref:class I SAM-dependent RNA methyltransferase n=1 Tax=Roseovarius sp. THAF27 TaxID=2587850 RepID=UPI001267DDFF|nr:class I SAM-dependent RNA methyltransferase [Roseovarius sp. THAF27]QFT83015.1 23S rRNA (uracil-C(5))-methyltransferase RlmCD [Roseovarius sp. THAF27]
MAEFVIERLGHLGDGIAEGPVYVPGALPGERVTGTLEGNVLRDVKILQPAATRVKAPCRHYKSCGGCQLQHADDGFLADWKTGIVREALAAQGIETEMREIAVSPANARRRAGFSARRTKKGATAGFHAKGSDVIVELSECQVVVPELLEGARVAQALARIGTSRKGELSVAVALSEAGLDVRVEGGKSLDGPLRIALAQLAESEDLARLTWDEETVVTRRPPMQDFDGIAVTPPPGAFLQATKDSERLLQDEVAAILAGTEPVIDLFAGCGTFALPLARERAVHAVEGSAGMTRALDEGWRHSARLKKVTVEVRDLFRQPVMAEDLKRFGGAVIDPPRAGAEAQCRELAEAQVPVIAYVSCNPVTFARDAKILTDAGYVVEWVRPVDQFRWSVHVELVAAIRRKTG